MNYGDIIAEIRSKLNDFLLQNGVDPGKKFSCLHPSHEDKSPSASVIPGKDIHRVKCFSCGRTYDIFDVANYLKGYPLNGAGFITETIPNLINDLALDIDVSKINFGAFSPEIQNAKHLMSEIAHIATVSFEASPDKEVKKEIKKREWSKETVSEHGIGQSFNIANYIEQLKIQGFYDKDFVDLGLTDAKGESIFLNDQKRIFFPLYDAYYNVVGFSLRSVGDYTGPKYLNTINSVIYNKSKYLYGMFKLNRKSKKAYMMEGYTDVIRFHENKIENAFAYCSANFTSEQISLLYHTEIRDLVFCLDCDAPSINGVVENIKKNYESLIPYNVKIKIPNFGDPDEFIQKEGIEKYLSLPEIDFFTFYIKVSLKNEADPKELLDECLSLLICHTSEAAAEIKLKQISNAFGNIFSQDVIRLEYTKLYNNKTSRIDSKVNSLKKDFMRRLTPDIEQTDFMDMVDNLHKKIESLKSDNQTRSEYGSTSILERILLQEDKEMARTSGLEAFKFNKFKDFQDHVDGSWGECGLMGIGGTPNTGKTTFMCNLMIDLIQSNDDVSLIMYSIDDEAELIFTRLVSILSSLKYPPIELNAFRNPNKFLNKYPHLMEARAYGYSLLKQYVKEGRLKVYDSRYGKNTKSLRNIMMAHKESTDMKGIVMLDNFHKLEGSERSEIEQNSSYIKDMSQEFLIPVWTTMEYKKFERPREPTNSDLKETGKMEYDAKLILHLHNDVHILGERSTMYYHDESSNKVYPIIKTIFGKNKLNSYKSNDYFVMNNECGLYVPISHMDVETFKESNVPYGDKMLSIASGEYYNDTRVVKKQDNPEVSLADANF